MTKPREWDCGSWSTRGDHNRITVRERSDGLYDVIHVRYVRSATGPHKTETLYGTYEDVDKAKKEGWRLWRGMRNH